jgi:hypothetical protein
VTLPAVVDGEDRTTGDVQGRRTDWLHASATCTRWSANAPNTAPASTSRDLESPVIATAAGHPTAGRPVPGRGGTRRASPNNHGIKNDGGQRRGTNET